MHLECVTSQDGGARFARSLAAVDKENFFVGRSRAATKWWAIHTTLPKRVRPLGRVIQIKSALRVSVSQHK